MTVKIDQKIVNCSVVKETAEPQPSIHCPNLSGDGHCTKEFHPLELPDVLAGKRYRLKSPLYDSSLYMIVMDAEVNGELRPVEVFFESKNMESYSWIKFTARMVSALLRQPGPFPTYIIDEMEQTSAPNGSYFLPKGGGKVESIVHHIGKVLKQHCMELGLLSGTVKLDAAQVEYLEKKKEELGLSSDSENSSEYPEYATACAKCGEKAVILMDGCSTCLSCSDSKCG